MPAIPMNRSLGFFRRMLVYVWARLEANPATGQYAPDVKKLIGQIDALRAKHQDAEDEVILAYARRDQADEDLDLLIQKAGRLALDQSGGNRESVQFKNLFPAPPHEVVGAPIDEELAQAALLVEKLKSDPKNVEAVAMAAVLAPAIEALGRTQRALPEKTAAQALVAGEGHLVRDSANRSLSRLEGTLLVQWPGEKSRVRRFFEYVSRALKGRGDSPEGEGEAETVA